MKPRAANHVRIARPSHDLRASERFWVKEAVWHLELAADPDDAAPAAPTEEDLLVLYVGGEVDAEVIRRLVDAGGTRVAARNPYRDRWGVTIADPDGYRLVLSGRAWP